MATDTANANCRELLDVLIAQGVERIVLSPGSRNTPLLVGASARSRLRKYLITDERTAGFAALGMAMETNRPVALACTSGTAMYNYAPAIAEAYYQKIPLIVITADRPAQWIDQDDSQTLRQAGALDKIVKRSYDIYAETGMSTPCANSRYESEREWYVNRIANEAVLTALTPQPGPVHINMQFAEPLNQLTEYNPKETRIIKVEKSVLTADKAEIKRICSYLADKRVMLTVGFMPADDSLSEAVVRFSKLDNVTVIAETLSNVDLHGHQYMADSLLTGIDRGKLEELAPDIVISIGGALVSRMLKEYIRKSKHTEHWTLGDTDVSVDCFQRLTTHIDMLPAEFLNRTARGISELHATGQVVSHSRYNEYWRKERERISTERTLRLAEMPWCELSALNRVIERVPKDWNIFLSNGTSVRYAQILTDRLQRRNYCNRGVSGIDGTNATALGVSLVSELPTLLISGDMSFAYCPEVMHLRNMLGGDLRIIVMNNCGGGIFRFIRTTRDLEMREEYFCCDSGLPIDRLTEAYGWHYEQADSFESLSKALDVLVSTPATLVEITADPELSAEILRDELTPRQ